MNLANTACVGRREFVAIIEQNNPQLPDKNRCCGTIEAEIVSKYGLTNNI